MEASTFSCDVCERQQQGATDWFAVHAINELQFRVQPWEEARACATLSSNEHICGQECLHKRLNQWLAINSRTTPAT